jgi:hypothetical protein
MITPVKPRYLTKSRFKMALECPTKLFYAAPGNGYFDKNQNNDFLQALADGGNQVGELAKFKYHDDPVGAAITVETLNAQDALAQTQAKLDAPGRVVVAEAALLHAPFFIRVDILILDKEARTIDLIEVKSKSVDDGVLSKGFRNNSGYDPHWLPYLYDVAFQAEVAQRVFPDHVIRPKLLLVDSQACCDIDGLHQHFKIVTELDPLNNRTRVRVQTPAGLSRSKLGSLGLLREVDVADIVADLRRSPIDNAIHIPEPYRQDLLTFMDWAGQLQTYGKRYFFGVSKACRNCQFRAPDGDLLRSGLEECWQSALGQGLIHGVLKPDDRATPLSIDLWGGAAGSKSLAGAVLEQGRAVLADVQEDDIRPGKPSEGAGLTPLERRLAQIGAARGDGPPYVLDENRLRAMDDWAWPLHMIDFETSAPALPFFKGMRPYETLAFQFSHHVMEKLGDGTVRIRHANQWICTEAGVHPSIEFVRQLRHALIPDGQLHGTVFRYHNHENTVLRGLRKHITDQAPVSVPDAEELVAFIDLITQSTGDEKRATGHYQGPQAMVDLHRLVQEGYYSAHAGGSISLKHMLPAILHDAPSTASLHQKTGLYGRDLTIDSLNFHEPGGHVWLQASKGMDPYKTLPAIFGSEHGELNEMLRRLAGDDEEEGKINQGGLAMTAYNYTQFACLNAAERRGIAQALLRYCELDTMAMVMLVQGLFELRQKPLTLK